MCGPGVGSAAARAPVEIGQYNFGYRSGEGEKRQRKLLCFLDLPQLLPVFSVTMCPSLCTDKSKNHKIFLDIIFTFIIAEHKCWKLDGEVDPV